MDKNIEILKKQEDLLQFPHFNHSTAYEFGTFMVSCAQNQNITIAISIRMNNGCIAFVQTEPIFLTRNGWSVSSIRYP